MKNEMFWSPRDHVDLTTEIVPCKEQCFKCLVMTFNSAKAKKYVLLAYLLIVLGTQRDPWSECDQHEVAWALQGDCSVKTHMSHWEE